MTDQKITGLTIDWTGPTEESANDVINNDVCIRRDSGRRIDARYIHGTCGFDIFDGPHADSCGNITWRGTWYNASLVVDDDGELVPADEM